jgi:hypothetical protein
MVSVGGTLKSLSGDDVRAEVVILGWPAEDWLKDFALDRADLDPFWDIFRPIAEHVGLRYDWKRRGDKVTTTVSR